MPNKYGVRIYALPDSDVILIKQTVKRPESLRYIVDSLEDGTHREAHINVDDTVGIADAVRQALRGELGVRLIRIIVKEGLNMKIKWLGHASFMITSDTGTKLITDPYEPNKELTYGEINESADIVTVSHDHFDHSNVAAVRGNPKVVKGAVIVEIKGIAIKGTPSYHDDADGKKRGGNIIFCFEVDGIRVCHLGDLGHLLSDKQVAEVGTVDILLIPVGGYFTINGRIATQVCNQLKPKVIIPMHWNYKWSFSEIASVDEFLRGKRDVSQLDASEVEFKEGELPASTQIIVLKSAL